MAAAPALPPTLDAPAPQHLSTGLGGPRGDLEPRGSSRVLGACPRPGPPRARLGEPRRLCGRALSPGAASASGGSCCGRSAASSLKTKFFFFFLILFERVTGEVLHPLLRSQMAQQPGPGVQNSSRVSHWRAGAKSLGRLPLSPRGAGLGVEGPGLEPGAAVGAPPRAPDSSGHAQAGPRPARPGGCAGSPGLGRASCTGQAPGHCDPVWL